MMRGAPRGHKSHRRATDARATDQGRVARDWGAERFNLENGRRRPEGGSAAAVVVLMRPAGLTGAPVLARVLVAAVLLTGVGFAGAESAWLSLAGSALSFCLDLVWFGRAPGPGPPSHAYVVTVTRLAVANASDERVEVFVDS